MPLLLQRDAGSVSPDFGLGNLVRNVLGQLRRSNYVGDASSPIMLTRTSPPVCLRTSPNEEESETKKAPVMVPKAPIEQGEGSEQPAQCRQQSPPPADGQESLSSELFGEALPGICLSSACTAFVNELQLSHERAKRQQLDAASDKCQIQLETFSDSFFKLPIVNPENLQASHILLPRALAPLPHRGANSYMGSSTWVPSQRLKRICAPAGDALGNELILCSPIGEAMSSC
eukprot:gene9047-16170_t